MTATATALKSSRSTGLQFPEYSGERFISESVAWIYLAKNWDMLMVNKIVYITEYLEGGLSMTGRKLRFQCPNLMAYGSLMTMSKEFSTKIRIKETLLYIVYSKFGKKTFIQMLKCPYKWMVASCYVPGVALYHIWKKKYQLTVRRPVPHQYPLHVDETRL